MKKIQDLQELLKLVEKACDYNDAHDLHANNLTQARDFLKQYIQHLEQDSIKI